MERLAASRHGRRVVGDGDQVQALLGGPFDHLLDGAVGVSRGDRVRVEIGVQRDQKNTPFKALERSLFLSPIFSQTGLPFKSYGKKVSLFCDNVTLQAVRKNVIPSTDCKSKLISASLNCGSIPGNPSRGKGAVGMTRIGLVGLSVTAKAR